MVPDRTPNASPSRPLLDTRPDMHQRYLERTIDKALNAAVRRNLNTLITGPPGSGKTTTLHRLLWLSRQGELPEGDYILIRGRAATTPTQLLHLLSEAIPSTTQTTTSAITLYEEALDALSPTTTPAEPWAAALPAAESFSSHDRAPLLLTEAAEAIRSPSGDTRALQWFAGLLAARGDDTAGNTRTQDALQRLGNRLADRDEPVMFLIDDLDPVLGHQIFGVLRDEIWQLPAQWVVTTLDSTTDTLLQPPADAFFDLTLPLPPLTPADATELLRLRTGKHFTVPDRTWQPRDILKLATTTDPEHWDKQATQEAQQQADIAALGRPATVLYQILLNNGTVSPSDKHVLTETGWTRSRISQVLNQLHEAGHVTFTEIPTGRPGRPARHYRLTDPSDPT